MSLQMPNHVKLVCLMSNHQGHRDISIRRGSAADEHGEHETKKPKAATGSGATASLQSLPLASISASSRDARTLRPAQRAPFCLPPECYYG